MAPKTPSLSHQPTKEKEVREEPSSDEEDEEVEEEESEEEEHQNSSDETEEGSSEDEEEQEKVKSNKLSNPIPKFDSTISKENGFDSETDSDGSPSDYKLQPISQPSKPSAKRRHEEGSENQDSSKSSKKLRIDEKKSTIDEKKSSSTPGGCINRLWSDDDEIAVLNGMIEFKNVKGQDANADMGAFYNFIKGKLQADFSKDQLKTKIVRMKKRFLNALKKGETGSNPVFSKPHEDMVFELSKKIWGRSVDDRVGVKNENVKKEKNENEKKEIAKSVKKENAKKDSVKQEKGVVDEQVVVKKEEAGEEGDFWSKFPSLRASFHNIAGNYPSLAMPEHMMGFVKERLSLIGNAKAKELDEKWKQLFVEETELNYRRLMLMTEQVKMALNQ